MSDIAYNFDGPKHDAPDVNAIQAAIDTEMGVATASAPPAEPAKPAAPVSAPTIAAPAAPLAAEQTPAPASSLEQLKTHKITVDGQELEVTEEDLKSGHMRLRDYTQKTQTLAAEKKAIEAERQSWQQKEKAHQSELDAIDQFLRDKAALDQYIQKAFGSVVPVAPVTIDPNRSPTADEVAQIARYNAEQVRIANQRDIAALRQEQAQSAERLVEAQKASQRAQLSDAIDRHITSLVAKNPLLRKFEGIEDELIGMAAKYNPRGLDEGLQRITEAAERKLATVKSIVEDEKKAAAIEAARLKKTSPEPAGGTAPAAAPSQKKVSMDIQHRKDRLESNEAWLREAMASGS